MPDAEHQEEQAIVPAEGKSVSHGKFRCFRDCISKLVAHHPNHRSAPPPKSILKQSNTAVGDAISLAESAVPVGYKGPVHNRETGETVWAGSAHPSASAFSVQHIHPEGHRHAQHHWTFSMSGGISHQVPQHKWVEMDSQQQSAFNHAGRLPFRLVPIGKTSKPSTVPQPLLLEASPPPPIMEPVRAVGMACSACSNIKTAAVKKFPTRGGLMRPLCGDCVYDNVGGDQGAYVEEWAKGRPV